MRSSLLLAQALTARSGLANGLLRESGAQHRASDKRLECGVHGALTVRRGGQVTAIPTATYLRSPAVIRMGVRDKHSQSKK